jgi:Antibiotic biosynthesis monooxygenase
VHVVLVHWRVKPDEESVNAFLDHWREKNTIENREGLVGEFLSEVLSPKDFPDTTWHLDPESLGDCRSFVNVAVWRDAQDFHDQIAKHYNDKRPMLPFEKYRRRRLVAESGDWRIGKYPLPNSDSVGVR